MAARSVTIVAELVSTVYIAAWIGVRIWVVSCFLDLGCFWWVWGADGEKGRMERTCPLHPKLADHLHGEQREAGGDGEARECGPGKHGGAVAGCVDVVCVEGDAELIFPTLRIS